MPQIIANRISSNRGVLEWAAAVGCIPVAQRGLATGRNCLARLFSFSFFSRFGCTGQGSGHSVLNGPRIKLGTTTRILTQSVPRAPKCTHGPDQTSDSARINRKRASTGFELTRSRRTASPCYLPVHRRTLSLAECEFRPGFARNAFNTL